MSVCVTLKEGSSSTLGQYDTKEGVAKDDEDVIGCRAWVGENKGRHLDGELQDIDDEVKNGNGKL